MIAHQRVLYYGAGLLAAALLLSMGAAEWARRGWGERAGWMAFLGVLLLSSLFIAAYYYG